MLKNAQKSLRKLPNLLKHMLRQHFFVHGLPLKKKSTFFSYKNENSFYSQKCIKSTQEPSLIIY